MKYGLLIFLITLASSQRAIQFEDGDTHEGSLEANGIAHYYWDLKAPCTGNTCEAAFFLTTYSDWTQPHIYVNHDTAGYPTPEAFGWKSDVWGQWGVLLRKDDLEVGQYKLTVMCDKKCEYALSLSYARPITLIDGEPQTATFDAGWMVLYDFTPKVRGKFDVVVTPKIGAVSLHGTPPGSQDQLDVVDTWHNGRSIRQNNRDPDGVYNLSVSARNDTSYTIVADTKSTPIRLLASEPYHHYVSKEKWTHFRLNVDDPDTNVGIRLTTYTGEADIYVKAGEKPTLQDHDFVSRALGNETFTISGVQREWAGHSIGEYFIGILGIRNSAFILAATVNENSIIPMISGIPMQGYVDHGDTDHYALDIPFEHNLNITVQLTSLAHDADLYADELENPDRNTIWSSRYSTRIDSIVIEHKASYCLEHATSVCRYVFASYGKSQMQTPFTISANYAEDEELVLLNGHPAKRLVYRRKPVYFKYIVHDNSVSKVTFIVTPIDGDPDIYVSRLAAQPDKDSSEKYSDRYLDDSVTFIRGVDAAYLEGTYHISIRVKRAYAYFTLVAIEETEDEHSRIQLLPGISQFFVIKEESNQPWQMFKFRTEFPKDKEEPITVTTTKRHGDVTFTVENSENSEIVYPFIDASSASATIKPYDSAYFGQATYFVNVTATDYTQEEASFMIQYNTANTTQQLHTGTAIRDTLSSGSSVYYYYVIHDLENNDMEVTLSSIYGDPDLFISIGANNRPDKNNCDFLSQNYGSDVITIQNAELAEKCPKDQYCIVYIGIAAYQSTLFTITVQFNDLIPIFLTEGVSMFGQVNYLKYNYYYGLVDLTSSVTFNLQIESGDSDLYVNVADWTDEGSDTASWNKPSKSYHAFNSTTLYANEIVTVDPVKMADFCPSGKCIVTAGVYCEVIRCLYSISYNTGTSRIELMEGVPYEYTMSSLDTLKFTFSNLQENTEIAISLSSHSSGTFQMVVQYGTDDSHVSNYKKVKQINSSGKLIITAGDLPGESMIGTYSIQLSYIPDSDPKSYFTLTVTTSDTSIIRLSDAVPQMAHLEKNSKQYYRFFNSKQVNVKITVVSTFGNPIIYARTITQSDSRFPSQDNHFWTSRDSNDRYEITIRATDPLYCTDCELAIAVFSGSKPCDFTITVKNSESYLTLGNGVPFIATTGEEEQIFFVFRSFRDDYVDFQLTSLDNDADLFINNESPVTIPNAKWSSTQTVGVDHVRIDPSDENYPSSGDFYILVSAPAGRPSYFSLTVLQKDSYATLIDGWPQAFYLTDKSYFRFDVREQGDARAKCRVSLIDITPNIYVKFQSRSEDIINRPSASSHDQSFGKMDLNTIYSEYSFELESQRSGTYTFLVQADQGISGEVKLLCQSNAEMTVLTPDTAIVEDMPDTVKEAYYEFFISEAGDFEIRVEPCFGKIGMKVSSHLSLLKQGSSNIEVFDLSSGMKASYIANAQGKYFIQIIQLESEDYHDFSGVSFEITTFFKKEDDILSKSIIPGNSGLIYVRSQIFGETKVEWTPPVDEKGEEVDSESVKYYLYETEDIDNIYFITPCQMERAVDMDKASRGEDSYTSQDAKDGVKIEIVRGTPKAINIVAEITSSSRKQRIPYSYTVISRGNIHNRPGDIFWIVFGIVAGVVAIAAGIIGFVYWKYKKTQDRLRYEMEDVRNVAGISAHQEMADIREPVRFEELNESTDDS